MDGDDAATASKAPEAGLLNESGELRRRATPMARLMTATSEPPRKSPSHARRLGRHRFARAPTPWIYSPTSVARSTPRSPSRSWLLANLFRTPANAIVDAVSGVFIPHPRRAGRPSPASVPPSRRRFTRSRRSRRRLPRRSAPRQLSQYYHALLFCSLARTHSTRVIEVVE